MGVKGSQERLHVVEERWIHETDLSVSRVGACHGRCRRTFMTLNVLVVIPTQHLEETLGQQRLLVGCIERLGGSPSAMKDVMGKVAAFGQAAGGALNSDEIIKGSRALRDCKLRHPCGAR
jgi:hypothetical protein